MTEDSTPESPLPPAGWYPDATSEDAERYWDGAAWTAETRPRLVAATPAVAAPAWRRSRRVSWIIAGSVAAVVMLIAAGVGVVFIANSPSSGDAASTPTAGAPDGDLVVIPDLRGMTVADARAAVEDLGLIFLVPDGTDEQEIVATQTRRAGEEVALGAEVMVTVEATVNAEGDSLTFAAGDDLDPMALVGWQLSLGADDAVWTSSPDAESGEVVFVKSDGTCSAQFWQETFDASADDDLAATDEFLSALSGATAEDLKEYAFDGYFGLSRGPEGSEGGDVANRNLFWDLDEGSIVLAARVFHTLDYAASTMNNAYSMEVRCDPGIDPVDHLDSLYEVAKITVTE